MAFIFTIILEICVFTKAINYVVELLNHHLKKK